MMLPVMHPDCPATPGAARVGFNSVKLPVFIKGVGTVERIVVALLLLKSCTSPKEEGLVLDDRAADGSAKLILAEVAPGHAARVVQKRVRIEVVVAYEFPHVAMEANRFRS